jgi:hypothetical protein
MAPRDPYKELHDDHKSSIEAMVQGTPAVDLPVQTKEGLLREAYQHKLLAEQIMVNAEEVRDRHLEEEKRLLALAKDAPTEDG